MFFSGRIIFTIFTFTFCISCQIINKQKRGDDLSTSFKKTETEELKDEKDSGYCFSLFYYKLSKIRLPKSPNADGEQSSRYRNQEEFGKARVDFFADPQAENFQNNSRSKNINYKFAQVLGKTAFRNYQSYNAKSDIDFFLEDLRAKSRGQKKLLIYIHGFFTTFEKGLKDSAYFARKSGFDGNVLYFWWHSRGIMGFNSYRHDASNASRGGIYLARLLQKIKQKIPRTEISLISHSMGVRTINRTCDHLLSEVAISNLSKTNKAKIKLPLIDKMIMIAPDADADLFRQHYMRCFSKISSQTHIFCQSNDAAINTSKFINGIFPRICNESCSFNLPENISIYSPKLSKTDLVNHKYHISSEKIAIAVNDIWLNKKPNVIECD